MLNLIRIYVSENRCRYEDASAGINLDLSYITDRIIAMSYPSTGFEALYRNSLETVKQFLNQRHAGHYKVYNLRSEKGYSDDTFSSAPVATYAFDDHQAPPFQLLVDFCEDSKRWMAKDTKNIVAIHCKAGKGRTGTVIAALLLYLHEAQHAQDAIEQYGLRRTKDGKGVTIPSQIRYVYYFERWLLRNQTMQMNPLMYIKQLVLHGAADACSRGLTISVTNHLTTFDFDQKNCLIQTISPDSIHVTLPSVPAQGDLRIVLQMKSFYFKKSSCRLWLNTSFIDDDTTVSERSWTSSFSVVKLSKDEIDGAANDVDHHQFPASFAVEIEIDPSLKE